MKPEIVTAIDPETGTTDVLVNSVTFMRVYPDGTIEGYRGITGNPTLSEIVMLRSQEYIAWINAEADKIPALAGD